MDIRFHPILTRRFYGCGSVAGKVFSLVVAVGFLVWQFYEWLYPVEDIDIAPDFPCYEYNELQMVSLRVNLFEFYSLCIPDSFRASQFSLVE
jgi:hypothetical protein